MISNQDRSILISSMGWVDKGSFWCYDVKRSRQESLAFSEAKYLTLHLGKDDYFSIVHHFDGSRLEITAHCLSDPKKVLSKIVILTDKFWFDGDCLVWEKLPAAYTASISKDGITDCVLILVVAESERVDVQKLDWYNETYDKMYQGIIGVVQIPGERNLIISIQRNSQPVVYDPIARQVVGKLSLAGRNGNPDIYFRRTANELWADDYDTILRIGTDNWQIRDTLQLQPAENGMVRQFIGDFAFDPDEKICAVARPFSNDIVGVDTCDFKVKYRCNVGKQPLEIALLPDQSVFSRDWKTGDLLCGRLKKYEE